MDNEWEFFTRGKIVSICELMLNDDIGIISGSRKLAFLRHQMRDELNEDFVIFVGIDSQTDHLPVDWERKNWSKEALELKDKEIAECELHFKSDAFDACKKLIQRFNVSPT